MNIVRKNLRTPVFLPARSYMMSNGYKPSPLDLSDIKLTPGQEMLVDKLAENAHNVWAKDRIKQGWTYGIQQVVRTHVCIQGVVAAVSKKHLFTAYTTYNLLIMRNSSIQKTPVYKSGIKMLHLYSQ